MDGDTVKHLVSRIRSSDLDEEAQEEAIAQIKAERADSRPSAVVNITAEEDDMGGNARLSLGERTPVTVGFPVDEDDDGETVYEDRTLFLTLNRLDGEPARGAGAGSAQAYDDDQILADYHLTYGQGKALLRLLEPETTPGTPGDVGSRLRHVLGNPDEVNPLLRDIQENGVRGWRRVREGRP